MVPSIWNLRHFALILAVLGLFFPAAAHDTRSFVISGDPLEHHGPFLGVWLGANEDGDGAYVRGVVDGSGADKAGLKKGDVIVGIDGTEIVDSGDLSQALDGLEVGDSVSIDVLRDGERVSLDAELGEHKLGALIGSLDLPQLKHPREDMIEGTVGEPHRLGVDSCDAKRHAPGLGRAAGDLGRRVRQIGGGDSSAVFGEHARRHARPAAEVANSASFLLLEILAIAHERAVAE